ncbi:MAG: MATE family efflux transporter [Lachnospiraceae bacterium]|nr:MATE family efflux transporter [Lachnospiraceae bacterium]
MKTKMKTKANNTQPASRLFSNHDLLILILPLVLEQALAITVGMADTMMVSNAGEAAVSGVSLVDMFNNLVFAVLSALSTGGAVVTSQFLGAKKRESACHSVMQLIVSTLLITIVLSILIILGRWQLIRLFFGSIDADVFAAAALYMGISALSYPFLAVYNASAAIFRVMNNAKITLKVSIVMNLINVVGNAIGIFVLHAGVVGVAVPSLISRAFAATVLYVLLHNPKLEIHIDPGRFRFDPNLIRRIYLIGIPSGIENGIFQLGRVVVVSIISNFGTVQIAANGVANSLDAMGVIGGQAMNLAMIAVIGRCVGAGDEEQIRYYTRKLILCTYGLTLLFSGSILLFLDPILTLYGLGEETTALAALLVRIHDGFAILFWPMAFTFPNMLRACNDVKYTMGISIFSMCVFRIGISIVLGLQMGYGAVGVWIGMVIDWVFRILCFTIRYFRGTWRRLALL